LPQRYLIARIGDDSRKARGFLIVRRGRRPNPLDTEFPFRKLSVHGATPGEMNTTGRVKLSVSASAILN
jgi:hypothetical protein